MEILSIQLSDDNKSQFQKKIDPCDWFCGFKFQVLFVTYTTIQRLYNQQWNESRVRSMDSANIEKYNTREVYIK